MDETTYHGIFERLMPAMTPNETMHQDVRSALPTSRSSHVAKHTSLHLNLTAYN